MSIALNGDGFILDDDGFAVPAADLLADFFAEHGDDPDEGPPESWPAWTDEIELDLGEPTEQDLADYRAWCLEVDRRNQDLEDARRASEYLDMVEGYARFTDDDLEAAGLAVG